MAGRTGRRSGPRTLAIDIGGSGLKATVLDARGGMLVERARVATPKPSRPAAVVRALLQLVAPLPSFDRVSVGFPGVVRAGRVLTAPNLGTAAWRGFDLKGRLERRLGRPVVVLNDADMQGYGAIRGRGMEMVITLGTGFGTALFEDGRLAPHLEIAHHPFRKGETYDQQLGDAARRRLGRRKWSRRVAQAIANLRSLVHFDHLYVGGGNARRLILRLPRDVSLVDNNAGLTGGIAPWREPATARGRRRS